jgi:hypothetical protein
MQVRIPPMAWMNVCCECCVLSGRGLCVRLITGPDESYQTLYVCDFDTSKNEEAYRHTRGVEPSKRKCKWDFESKVVLGLN